MFTAVSRCKGVFAPSTSHGHSASTLRCRLPLGVPARLFRQARALAEKLIGSPGSQRAAGQGVEREAGYAVMSALAASGAVPAEQVGSGAGWCWTMSTHLLRHRTRLLAGGWPHHCCAPATVP